MPTGRIEWLDKRKGIGYIKPSDGREEVFVHLSDLRVDTCKNDVCEGERVQYEVRKDYGRKKAKNIRSIETIF